MITNLRNIDYMHHDYFLTIMMDDDDNILGESISTISGYNLHQVSLANRVCDMSLMSYKYSADGYMEPDYYGGHIIVKNDKMEDCGMFDMSPAVADLHIKCKY